jgi:hypothetical protein
VVEQDPRAPVVPNPGVASGASSSRPDLTTGSRRSEQATLDNPLLVGTQRATELRASTATTTEHHLGHLPKVMFTTAAIFLLAGGIGGLWLARLLEPAPAASHATATTIATTRTTEQVAQHPRTLEELAALGDQDALERIVTLPAGKRSPTQVLALATGQDVVRRMGIEALAKELSADPARITTKVFRDRLLAYAADGGSATTALRVMAGLEGPWGPDLLYEVWTGTAGRTRSTEIAEQLLSTPAIREKSTRALKVALDLRQSPMDDCAGRKEAVTRAVEEGDSRSLQLIAKLARRYGCGAMGRLDCHACLREGDLVARAMAAVRSRKGPEL